jgi:hypothetical protein
MRLCVGLAVLLLLLLKVTNLSGAQREEVTFPSGKSALRGMAEKPDVGQRLDQAGGGRVASHQIRCPCGY